MAEALTTEREKRRREAEDNATRREVGRAVLQALAQRLNAEPLPTWFFISKGDEILVAHTKNGAASRQHVGTWVVDQQMRLVLEQEMTEWITAESCARVVDEAVAITAKFIVDAESKFQLARRELAELPRRM
ncbi:hypothetical protein GIW81_08230 [Hyphomicrobium sp. xq]|uniref:Uncharacterized protein n=1 Tax=Hyphomicrobium album TaxID=2665159 RepID=A0A6I3KKQ3_9HYPH|nr:hypothetical protein [Hyphomicrobium album]MTD94322.1 hypothetical protein [Hyphomicrobium album]